LPQIANRTPYITPVELINAPLGIDWNSMPSRGSTSPNAEQVQLCWRVTERMDELAEQVLRTTVFLQQERGPDYALVMDRSTFEGRLRCQQWPVLQVISGQWSPSSTYPPAWTSIPVSSFQIDEIIGGPLYSAFPGAARGAQYINIAPGIIDWSSGRNGIRLQVQYIAGHMINCGLLSAAAINDSTIHVDDICGWNVVSPAAGRIYDGASTEGILVTSAVPDTSGAVNGPGVLHLQSNLQEAHALGTRVAQQDANLQQAGFYLAAAYARIRGATTIAPQARGAPITASKSVQELERMAEDIVKKYGLVVV